MGKDVSVGDLLEPIRGGELKFCMTSATQSNSGASAYIGFLYALLGNPESLTSADLESESLRTQMTELLSGGGPFLRQLRLAERYVPPGGL